MKLVYCAYSLMEADSVHDQLEQEGIQCLIRKQEEFNAISGVTNIAFEIYVEDNVSEDAIRILSECKKSHLNDKFKFKWFVRLCAIGGIVIIIVMLIFGFFGGIHKEEKLDATSAIKSEEQKNAASDDITLIKTNLSINKIGKQDGWFGELLKEKLRIEMEFCPYMGVFGMREEGTDLYMFGGGLDYYEAVKNGELRNLENEFTQCPEVYKKYKKALKSARKDTYDNTGKKGIYGLPLRLYSFKQAWDPCYCISIPADATHPEKAMDLLTYLASDEGIMNIAFGPEGQMWKKEGDDYVLIQDWYEIFDKDPTKKVFIETPDGKVDFLEARVYIGMGGYESLGHELVK